MWQTQKTASPIPIHSFYYKMWKRWNLRLQCQKLAFLFVTCWGSGSNCLAAAEYFTASFALASCLRRCLKRVDVLLAVVSALSTVCTLPSKRQKEGMSISHVSKVVDPLCTQAVCSKCWKNKHFSQAFFHQPITQITAEPQITDNCKCNVITEFSTVMHHITTLQKKIMWLPTQQWN